MNHLLNLTKKEVKELLAPGTIVSIIVMVFILMGVGSMIGGEMDSVTAPSKIGIVNGDPEGEWSEFAIESIFGIYESQYNLTQSQAEEYIIMLSVPRPYDDKEIAKEMANSGVNSAFKIMPGFSRNIDNQEQGAIEIYHIFAGGGLMESATSAISPLILLEMSKDISHKLISESTGGPTADFLLNPVRQGAQYTYVNGEVHEGITPADLSMATMGQTMMVPIVIMMIIIVIGGMVISSMGSEKENKTLETLLTIPMNRTTIVSGKLLAAAIVGLIYGMAYMVGMSFYIGGVVGSSNGINLNDYGLGIGPIDWAIIAVMIFLGIFCALAMCMILGAFTKNYKAAQTLILPITVLTMVPMFITMFSSWSSLPAAVQAVLFAIPFSHPMMVVNNLMFGDMTLAFAGLAYLVIFTLAMIVIAVRIYKSDILLTGIGQTKAASRAKRLMSRGRKI